MEDVADDEFGELYGDLEVLVTAPPEQEQQQEQEDYDNDDDGGGNVKNNDADGDYIGSDSDDDLNIVLNDDDRRDFSVVPDEDVRGDSLCKNTECVDQLKDETEHVSSDAHGGRSRNGVNGGGYGSQFFRSKYMRTQGPVFVNNVKSSKSMGLTFDSSSFTKGRGNSTQNQVSSSSYFDGRRDVTNSMATPYGSFLPWHWNIYDVNIDKLEEKPWRIPGTDITDYFNFGFNENTWKQYCMSLGQLWQTSMQVGVPVNESAKLNQASTREQIDQAVSGSLVSPSSKCEVPKGRAIQVENSVVERQPSFNARCPRRIDSDVVIQIKVDDPSDNNSGYVDSNVHNLSEEEEFISGNNRNKNSSSSEHDVLFEEQLEDVKKSEESSGQKRNDLVPEIVKAQQLDREDQHLEDAEVLEEEIKTERVGIPDTCAADPYWSEPELSLDDQDLSLTSYTDNDSEETGDNLHGDNENNHSPLRSHLVNSDTDLKESESLHHKISKKKSFDRTPVNVSYYSRYRGPVQQGRRHHTPDSKLKKHIQNDNDVSQSHIPKSSGRNMSRWGHQFVNYRPKERLQYFGSHKRRYVSYSSETKQSWYHGAEKTVDDLVQAAYSEYSDREEGDSFRENANQYIRNDGDRREYFLEQRTLMEYNEDHDWHPANKKHHVNDDDLSLLSYRESRQIHPKHSSFPAKDRETQKRRMHHQPHYKDRNCNYDQWFDECEFEFLNRSCRMPSSFAEREMEYLNDKHEEKFPQIDRALKRYAERGRHHGSPPLVGDTPWSWKPDDDLDECPKYTHHQTSYSRYQRQPYTGSARNYVYRVNENFRGHEKHGHATNRGNDWHCGYTDAAEDEDCITFPVKECEFYPHPSDVPHWTNNDNDNVWHHDELHPEENTFFYEETPKHERYRHSHARVRINNIKFQQHQLNLSWRDRDRFLKRSSKVLSRDHCQQAVLRCRKSVNLIDRDGKSHAKSSRVMSNDRLENVDRGIAKKQTAFVGFDDSHDNAIKFDISKSVCDKQNKKSLQNLPDKGQKEGLDIEEGEIQTEEPSMEASVYQRDVSEGAALTDTVKKRRSQIGNDSELHTGNLDSQKILDTIAKMEKRRERFKQPIGIIKEAEKSLKLNADPAVDTDKIKEGIDMAVDADEIKQHRPARKRRWSGS